MKQINFILRILLTSLLIFTLMRVILLLSNYSYFQDLSLIDMLYAFAHGVRFDLSTIAFLLFIPLLLNFIPHKLSTKISAWLIFIILITAILALAMNVVFFQSVNRHVSGELSQISNDYGYLWRMIQTYWLWFLLYLFTVFLLKLLWDKFIITTTKIVDKFRYKLLFLPLFLILIVIAGRGGVNDKPMGVATAFTNSSAPRANLTLNGIYTATKSLLDNNRKQFPYDYFSDQEIFDATKISKNYPFQQQYTESKKSPNIILLQIESLSYQFIDALAHNNYGVTPYLDSLVTKSKIFHKFCATGQRSAVGLQATWVGIPVAPGLKSMENNLLMNKLTKIAQLAKQKKYTSFYAQSSRRDSLYVRSLMQYLGFDYYYGMEDIGKLLLNYPDDIKPSFGYDYETLMLLKRKLKNHFKNSKRPILMGFFSGTTHIPYIKLPVQFNHYPYQVKSLGGMLNSISYLDWSIQQFIEGLRKESWFNNTIFFITADHIDNISHINKSSDKSNYMEVFHIPLIIYSANPDLIKNFKTNQIRSQLDLMPTFIDLMGVSKPFAALGSSLLRNKHYPVINNMGYIMGSISKKGYVTTDLHKMLNSNMDKKTALTEYKLLLMILQRTAKSLRNDKWTI